MTIKKTKSVNSYFALNGGDLKPAFHPWRRYFARLFDIMLYDVLWSAFLAFAFHVNIVARSNIGNFLDSFAAIFLMLLLEPFWLHLFGTTPGKTIFGLRIETTDGRLLFYREGFIRTWDIIGKGMGFNIPIYNLIRLWKSYELCIKKKPQPWDDSMSYTIRDTKWYRTMYYIAAHAAVLAVSFTIISAQQLPPNRGDITVAEFVENYNYYAKLFHIDFGNQYLNENGKWAEKDFDGNVHIEIGHTEEPEYNFTTENGYVTEVSLAVEIKNNDTMISSYNNEMFLASLAFAGSQNQMKLYSKIPRRIAQQIEDNTFEDFHFNEAGVNFTCDTEYSGYSDFASDFLYPSENISEKYFILNFSVHK